MPSPNAQVDLEIHLPRPHPKQAEFVYCQAKRIAVKAGRRGGKTAGVATRAVEKFLAERRVLYAAPTIDQVDRFWSAVNRALDPGIQAGVFVKNETKRTIEIPGTEVRIKAKTAWNADSLRGDYADELILDEFQLMSEDAWNDVGAPMLIDNNGDAVFVFTPPSLHSASVSKATDPQHATKFFREAQRKAKLDPRRWAAFHFTSLDNPHVSAEAIAELRADMTDLSYRIEILGEDIDQAPGALWTRELVEASRVVIAPEFDSVVVAVDPSAASTGDEAGVITVGRHKDAGYVIADDSVQGSPTTWATAAVTAYYKHRANLIVAEKNNGGEMIALTIATVDPKVPVRLVHAARGKATRAEPVAARFEQGPDKPRRGFLVGTFPQLENELCLWQPGDDSPNRLDAMVWGFWQLLVDPEHDRYSEDESASYTVQGY